jgi:hypothetical protein
MPTSPLVVGWVEFTPDGRTYIIGENQFQMSGPKNIPTGFSTQNGGFGATHACHAHFRAWILEGMEGARTLRSTDYWK